MMLVTCLLPHLTFSNDDAAGVPSTRKRATDGSKRRHQPGADGDQPQRNVRQKRAAAPPGSPTQLPLPEPRPWPAPDQLFTNGWQTAAQQQQQQQQPPLQQSVEAAASIARVGRLRACRKAVTPLPEADGMMPSAAAATAFPAAVAAASSVKPPTGAAAEAAAEPPLGRRSSGRPRKAVNRFGQADGSPAQVMDDNSSQACAQHAAAAASSVRASACRLPSPVPPVPQGPATGAGSVGMDAVNALAGSKASVAELRAALGPTRPCYWLHDRPDPATHPLVVQVRCLPDNHSIAGLQQDVNVCPCPLRQFLHVLQDSGYRDRTRKEIEHLIGRWQRPQVMQWLSFHNLEQYSEAFANVTGRVRTACRCKCNNHVQTRLKACLVMPDKHSWMDAAGPPEMDVCKGQGEGSSHRVGSWGDGPSGHANTAQSAPGAPTFAAGQPQQLHAAGACYDTTGIAFPDSL